MVVKKRAKTKRRSKDIDIKIKGIDKADFCARGKTCGTSCGHFWIFGSALAMIMSYTRSESILWEIL